MKLKNYLNEGKISKKAFLSLHKSGKLGLVAGGVKGDLKSIMTVLNKENLDKIKLIKTTNIDVASQSTSGTTVKVFKEEAQGKMFYIVETKHDNSKNNQVSWDTIDYYCTVYMEI